MHTFVVPPLDGPVTGGTRYDLELLRALAEIGAPARAVDLDAARSLVSAGERGPYFVDSLFLEHVPELRSLGGSEVKLTVLVHYFPSLVASALGEGADEPRRLESAAFDCADAFVVTSALARRELERRVTGRPEIVAVEPGCTLRPSPEAPSVARVEAQVVANLVQHKGIVELLRALGSVVARSDDFSLRIAGGEVAEPGYAAACRAFARAHDVLGTRVGFDGPLDPASVAARLEKSNLFVSASFTESYGMALAEARAVGVPLLAFDAGNASQHVSTDAGGELFSTHGELAIAFVGLCRDRDELERRVTLARAHAFSLEPRTWCEAAEEFRRAFGVI